MPDFLGQHGPLPRPMPPFQLRRNLGDELPTLRLRSQHQRARQRRLDDVRQVMLTLLYLRRFRPKPTTVRALRCTTRP
jgi:hypothetical protein